MYMLKTGNVEVTIFTAKQYMSNPPCFYSGEAALLGAAPQAPGTLMRPPFLSVAQPEFFLCFFYINKLICRLPTFEQRRPAELIIIQPWPISKVLQLLFPSPTPMPRSKVALLADNGGSAVIKLLRSIQRSANGRENDRKPPPPLPPQIPPRLLQVRIPPGRRSHLPGWNAEVRKYFLFSLKDFQSAIFDGFFYF